MARRIRPPEAHRGMGIGGELLEFSSSEEDAGGAVGNRRRVQRLFDPEPSLPDEPDSPPDESEDDDHAEIIDVDGGGYGDEGDDIGAGGVPPEPDSPPRERPLRRLSPSLPAELSPERSDIEEEEEEEAEVVVVSDTGAATHRDNDGDGDGDDESVPAFLRPRGQGAAPEVIRLSSDGEDEDDGPVSHPEVEKYTGASLEQIIALQRKDAVVNLTRTEKERRSDARATRKIRSFFEPYSEDLVKYCQVLGFSLEYDGPVMLFGYHYWEAPTKTGPRLTYKMFSETVFNTGDVTTDTDRYVYQVKRILVIINRALNASQNKVTYGSYDVVPIDPDDMPAVYRIRDWIYGHMYAYRRDSVRRSVQAFWIDISRSSKYACQVEPPVDDPDIEYTLQWWSEAFLYGLNVYLDSDPVTMGPLIRRISPVCKLADSRSPAVSTLKPIKDPKTTVVTVASQAEFKAFIQSQVDRFGSLFMVNKDKPDEFPDYRQARHGALVALFSPYLPEPREDSDNVTSLLLLLQGGAISPAIVQHLRGMWRRVYQAMEYELEEFTSDAVIRHMTTWFEEKFGRVDIQEGHEQRAYLEKAASAALLVLNMVPPEDEALTHMTETLSLVKMPGFTWACSVFFLWSEYACHMHGNRDVFTSLWDSGDYNPERELQEVFEYAWREVVAERQRLEEAESELSPSPPRKPAAVVDLTTPPHSPVRRQSPMRVDSSPETGVTPHVPVTPPVREGKKKKKKKKGKTKKGTAATTTTDKGKGEAHVPMPVPVEIPKKKKKKKKKKETRRYHATGEGRGRKRKKPTSPEKAEEAVSPKWAEFPPPHPDIDVDRPSTPVEAVFVPQIPVEPEEPEKLEDVDDDAVVDAGEGEGGADVDIRDEEETPEDANNPDPETLYIPDYMRPEKPFNRFVGSTDLVRAHVVMRLHTSIEPSLLVDPVDLERAGDPDYAWFRELTTLRSPSLGTYCAGLGYDVTLSEEGLLSMSLVYWVGKGRSERRPRDRRLALVMSQSMDHKHSEYRKMYTYHAKRIIAIVNKGLNIVYDNPAGGRHFGPRFAFPKDARTERAITSDDVANFITENIDEPTPALRAEAFVRMLKDVPYSCAVVPPIDDEEHDFAWWQQAVQYTTNTALDDNPDGLLPAIRSIRDFSEIARTDRLDHASATTLGPYRYTETMVVSAQTFGNMMQEYCDKFDEDLRITLGDVSDTHPKYRSLRHNALLTLFSPLVPAKSLEPWKRGAGKSLIPILKTGIISPGHVARMIAAWRGLYAYVHRELDLERAESGDISGVIPRLIRYYRVLLGNVPLSDPDRDYGDLDRGAIFALSTAEPLTRDITGHGLRRLSDPVISESPAFTWVCATFILHSEFAYHNRYQADSDNVAYRDDPWSNMDFDAESTVASIWEGSKTVTTPVPDAPSSMERDVMAGLEEASAEERKRVKSRKKKRRAIVTSPDEEEAPETVTAVEGVEEEEEEEERVDLPAGDTEEQSVTAPTERTVMSETVEAYYVDNKDAFVGMGLDSWQTVVDSTEGYTDAARLDFLRSLV